MKKFNPFFLTAPRQGPRRYAFHLNVSGRWFMGFTALVTLLTLMSENNILYFLSSVLIGSLIFNSLFADLALYRMKFSRVEGEMSADSEGEDIWSLHNPTPLPILALEFGEWSEGKYEPHYFLSYLGPFAKRTLKLNRSNAYPRGTHHWQSLYVSSNAPMGFSEKFFHLGVPSSRMIWPNALESLEVLQKQLLSNPRIDQQPLSSERGTVDFSQVESVREYQWGDDLRFFAGTRTNFRFREIKVKTFLKASQSERLTLVLTQIRSPEELEAVISHVSFLVQKSFDPLQVLVLVLPSGGIEVLSNRVSILNGCAALKWSNFPQEVAA